MVAPPKLCLWLQSRSSLSLPSPGTSTAPAPWVSIRPCCVRGWVPAVLTFMSPALPTQLRLIYHPGVTSKHHLSEILWVPLHDFLVEWEHDLGLADNIYPYVCLYFFGIFFLPAPADPNSILLCRDCTCMWFQVSFPMRRLHGRRKNSVNCSWCLMLSMLKQRSYIKCWVFFLSEYLGTKPTQILIVHQISTRFFNVLHLMLSGLKLFARIPHQVQPFIFCFLWFLQTFVAHLLWEWKRGSKEKALLYSVKGNWFCAGIGDGRNSAEDRAQRDHFESWICLCC